MSCALSHNIQEGKLYIGNLAFKTTEEGLREAFGEHGEITFARVISDRDSGRSRYVGLCRDAGGRWKGVLCVCVCVM